MTMAGDRGRGTVEAPPPIFTGPVVVRTYRAKNMAKASAMLAAEAQIAYGAGYTIAGQAWAAGSSGCGSFLIALLLIPFFGLGLLVLIGLLIVKPAGTLTVTFEKPTDTRGDEARALALAATAAWNSRLVDPWKGAAPIPSEPA